MTIKEAKKIGGRQGIIFVGLGLLIAIVMIIAFMLFDKVYSSSYYRILYKFRLNIFIGVIIMLLCGHFFGQLAGKVILINKWNFILVGILSSMAVLFSTAFLAGWTGYFQEGFDYMGASADRFKCYIYKPFYWITNAGIIPTFILGIWFGIRIKKHNRIK